MSGGDGQFSVLLNYSEGKDQESELVMLSVLMKVIVSASAEHC